MKRFIAIFLIVLGCTLSLSAQNKFPKILNKGDSIKVNQKVWIQTIDSEIDQRIELKQTKLKLSDYISKTKQLEVLQDSIDKKNQERIDLLKEGVNVRDSSIVKLSALIDDCSKEAFLLRKEVVLLQSKLEKSQKAKVFWRKVAIISSSALGVIIAIKFL